MTNICVIPARGGSQRIPRKNIKLFHGKPIIRYSLEAANATGLFDEIIVSTDDDEIAKLCYLGSTIVHMRSAELARNDVGTLAVTGDVARRYCQGDDYVCCLYATAPMVRPADICRGYEAIKNYDVVHCISVGSQPLRDAAQFYWSRADAARNEEPYYDYVTAVERIDENRICDINTPEDWARAEAMYAELHK